ncbi:hypothetical protein INR49_021433 [Caranx melampygus]|nr:hypothetical protein INR49_021433 [Caranx melampygus]
MADGPFAQSNISLNDFNLPCVSARNCTAWYLCKVRGLSCNAAVISHGLVVKETFYVQSQHFLIVFRHLHSNIISVSSLPSEFKGHLKRASPSHPATVPRLTGFGPLYRPPGLFQEVCGLLACGEMKGRRRRRFPP